jgi:hypothetical protein
MMSENPILLIDSRWPSFIGELPKRCYFIPDAHSAIPFIWDENTGNYTAPPWFDAILLFEDDDRSDDIPPSKWYVWLNQKTIKYTFEPHYEDVPQNHVSDALCKSGDGERSLVPYGSSFDSYGDNNVDVRDVSAHFNDGTIRWDDYFSWDWGIPYYGLVTKIEDHYGNRIEYNYTDFKQTLIDNDTTSYWQEAYQNGPEKGQIKSLKLISKDNSGNDLVAWTLLYVHRAFQPNTTGTPFNSEYTDGLYHPYTFENKLHAIYAYEGDINVPDETLTIQPDIFRNANTLDDLDSIDAESIFNLDANWMIKTQYLYSNAYWPKHGIYNKSLAPNLHDPSAWADMDVDFINYSQPHILLKTNVTRRSNVGTDHEVSNKKLTLYRYEQAPSEEDPENFNQEDLDNVPQDNVIKSIFYDDTINTIIRGFKENDSDWDENENYLINITDNESVIPIKNPETGEFVNYSLNDLADISFNAWKEGPVIREVDGAYFHRDFKFDVTDFAGDKTKSYGGIDGGSELNDFFISEYMGNADVWLNRRAKLGFTDRSDEQGGNSNYVMFSYFLYPDGLYQVPIFAGHLPDATYPTDIKYEVPPDAVPWFHYPYRVFNGTSDKWEQPKLDERRIVTIIDEINNSFDVLQELYQNTDSPESPWYFDNSSGAYPGLLNRRVVELNPAGFILRDRTWSQRVGVLQIMLNGETSVV